MRKMKHIFVILGILFLVCVTGVSARTLDIIVGGNNQGLECKTDTECGKGRYCNMEQYYCISCALPSHEWTGTECRCPANRPVEKSDSECVQCLQDADCTGSEQFCNTNTNVCTSCKSPKEWNDNVCACPSKTHESGDDCICDNPNTNLDEFNFCACGLTPDSCASTDLNLNECMCCPVERPMSMGSECKTCAQIDPSNPVWDSVSKTCKPCDTPTIYWDEMQEKCDCPQDTVLVDQTDGTKACWPYCEKQDAGVILLVDRSSSTKSNGLYKYINQAANGLVFPEGLKTAIYLDDGTTDTKLKNPVPYGVHSYVTLKPYFDVTSGFRTSPSGTTFLNSLAHVFNNICTGREKLMLIMWTDAELSAQSKVINHIRSIKTKCPNSKFYFIAPKNVFTSVSDAFFKITALPTSYVDILNKEIKQEGCVPKK